MVVAVTEIKKRIKPYVKITAISFLIGIIIGAVITYAVTPSSTYIISPRICPGAPTYTIWRESSNYFAKDKNGLLGYSGTNFTALFENATDAMPSEGGKIFLKAGSYEGNIVLNRDGIILEGEGCWATQTDLSTEPPPSALYGTVIKPSESQNGIEITNWGGDDENPGKWKYGIQIRNLGIWFTTASTGHGITTGTPYNKTTVTNLVVENVKVLNNDKSHYGIQLCNFLYSTVRNVLVWGGPLIEIYANSEWLHQGNSIFDQLFCRINYDLQAVEHQGPYPIFIHRNSSINAENTWTALCHFRRLQVNNPIHQTGDDTWAFVEAYICDIQDSNFQGLNLEGVNDKKVRVGTAYFIRFESSYLWTMDPGDAQIDLSSDTKYVTWENCVLEDVLDGNYTNQYINCRIYGDINEDTKANFIGLEGNSGFNKVSSGFSSVNVSAMFIGTNYAVFIQEFQYCNISLYVSAIYGAPANVFTVSTIDGSTVTQDHGFFWKVELTFVP